MQAQPELVVIARLEGARGPGQQAAETGGGVTIAAVGPGCPVMRIRVAVGAALAHDRELAIERRRHFVLCPTQSGG